MAPIPDTLKAAYHATTYRIHFPHRTVEFRVNEPCPAIDEYLESNGFKEWSFMTAYNPFSELLSETENEIRQQQLISNLCALGYAPIPGEGIGENGDWPPEHALFIPGMPLDAALEQARAFEQYGLIHAFHGEPPKLIFC